MKKILCLAASISIAFTITAQKKNVIIKASMSGIPAEEWIYIRSLCTSHKDSVKPNAKGFTIALHIPEGEGCLYTLQIGKSKTAITEGKGGTFYFENGTFLISNNKPSFIDAVVSGGKDAAYFNAYRTAEKLPELKALGKKLNEARANKDSILFAALMKEAEPYNIKQKALDKKWYIQHASTPAITYPLFTNFRFFMSSAQLDSLLQLATPAAKNNLIVRKIEQKILSEKLVQVGKPAPLFSQPDTSGKMIHLKDFRGQYVLIDFWASWCVPCRKENPNVVAVFHKYKDRHFTVLGVSLDQRDDYNKWIKAIQDDQLPWTQVSDLKSWSNEAGRLYGISSIPSNVLVDPKGIIVGMNLRGEGLHKKLEELLDKK